MISHTWVSLYIEIHYDNVHSVKIEEGIPLMFDRKLSSYFKNTHTVAILRYLSKQSWFMITKLCIIVWFQLLHTQWLSYSFCTKPGTKQPPYSRYQHMIWKHSTHLVENKLYDDPKNRRVSQIRPLLAAYRELAVDYNRLWAVLYVWEKNNVFWSMLNIPALW